MSQFAAMNTMIKTNAELTQREEFVKTRSVCRDWLKGNCRRQNCKFAHSKDPGQTNAAAVMRNQLNPEGSQSSQAGNQGGQSVPLHMQDCYHWLRGFCRNGDNCTRRHTKEMCGTRKRSNSHGTLQSFQQGAGNNFVPGALAPLKETGTEMVKMPEIAPNLQYSKEALKQQIADLEKASTNWGFGEQMVQEQLNMLLQSPTWENNMDLVRRLMGSLSSKSGF